MTSRSRGRRSHGIEGIGPIEIHGDELTVATADGAAAISPVAVALNACAVRVRDLTLRTPTLDDVFLELTGNRIDVDREPHHTEAGEVRVR